MYQYNVKLDGKPIYIYSARVSALPLNQLWDGNQRPVEQTEMAYYVTVDIEKESKMEIEVSEHFEHCEIRPLSKNIRYDRKDNKIFLSVNEPGQFTVEIDGYHSALHVFVNKKSTVPRGCSLYFEKGIHDVGLLWLESNQTIYLEEGAILNGVIYGQNVSNIKICGRGVIDSGCCRRGNDDHEGGQEIKCLFRKKGFDADNLKYIGNLVLQNCKNVSVEGIILMDSPLWSVIIRDNCENITMDNIKIIGQWRYNADGVDICTSKNVTLKNSFIRSFDDCVVVRGAYLPGEEGNVENVLVENCVCWCDWNIALEVWCGHKKTAIRNVRFKDNYIIRISTVVMDIKTWCGSADTRVEDVDFDGVYIDADDKYRNCVIESKECKGYREKEDFRPHMLTIYAQIIGKPVGVGTQICDTTEDGSTYNLLYRNIHFNKVRYSGKPLPSFVVPKEGLLMIENITFTDCDFEVS